MRNGLRFSSFTIVSDVLPSGWSVLMNGCSGALDVIPPKIADVIRATLATGTHGEVYLPPNSLDEDVVASFSERGHLTELSHAEEKALVGEIARGLHDLERKRPHFMIAPNMDCNYRCTYCFERHIQKKLNSESSNITYAKNNVVMRHDFVPRIYESIGAIQQAANQEIGGMIILYGGEPLDADNKDIVFDIVGSGSEKGYWFAAITNGHDLDQFLPILDSEILNQVQVSVDGPKRIHDKRRVHRGKESSFDKIVANVNTVLEKGGVEIQIRVHVDPQNIGLFEETLKCFQDQGWINNSSVVIYANTVYSKEKDGTVSVDMDVGEITVQLSGVAARYSNVFTSAPAVHMNRAAIPSFEDGDRFGLKGTYCSANAGNYIFAPDGQIYACWESIGKECSKIGSYMAPQSLTLDPIAIQKWFTRCVADIPECMECEFALVCGGGCAQYAEYRTGKLFSSYCDDFQRTFRAVLANEVHGHLGISQGAQGAVPRSPGMVSVGGSTIGD